MRDIASRGLRLLSESEIELSSDAPEDTEVEPAEAPVSETEVGDVWTRFDSYAEDSQKKAEMSLVVKQALDKGGRWVRAFNRSVIVMPDGKFIGVPGAIDMEQYAGKSLDAKTAVLKGPNKSRIIGPSTLQRLPKRSLTAHIARLDKAIERGNTLKAAVERDLEVVNQAKKDATDALAKRAD